MRPFGGMLGKTAPNIWPPNIFKILVNTIRKTPRLTVENTLKKIKILKPDYLLKEIGLIY